jgi:hypothetical protein
LESRALVKMLGGGKLGSLLVGCFVDGRRRTDENEERTEGCQCLGKIWRFARGVLRGATCCRIPQCVAGQVCCLIFFTTKDLMPVVLARASELVLLFLGRTRGLGVLPSLLPWRQAGRNVT